MYVCMCADYIIHVLHPVSYMMTSSKPSPKLNPKPKSYDI